MKLTNALIILLITGCLYSCNQSTNALDDSMAGTVNQQKEVISMLDSFNIAAANADYKTYFNFFDEDAIYTGTDATERWTKKEYMDWAKPYFVEKTTWNFTSIERHIYFAKTGNLSWFDELLNTQMKIWRGSGVLIKRGNV